MSGCPTDYKGPCPDDCGATQDECFPMRDGASTVLDLTLRGMRFELEHSVGPVTAQGWANLAAAEKEVADMRTEIAALKAEVARLTALVQECRTCDGSGIMDVVVSVEPHDMCEICEPQTCAECAGTGVSSWGQALARAEKAEAALAAARRAISEALNSGDGVYRP